MKEKSNEDKSRWLVGHDAQAQQTAIMHRPPAPRWRPWHEEDSFRVMISPESGPKTRGEGEQRAKPGAQEVELDGKAGRACRGAQAHRASSSRGRDRDSLGWGSWGSWGRAGWTCLV